MPNDRTKVIPLADLRTEPGSDELVRSESMNGRTGHRPRPG